MLGGENVHGPYREPQEGEGRPRRKNSRYHNVPRMPGQMAKIILRVAGSHWGGGGWPDSAVTALIHFIDEEIAA